MPILIDILFRLSWDELSGCSDDRSSNTYRQDFFYMIDFEHNHVHELVERELEAALHRIGCISDSNHLHLDKINWSRSSRTDKGVHAARLVISAKLLFPPNCIEKDNEDFQSFISMVNKELPDDIRVFSCMRVNQGFYARGACTWRWALNCSVPICFPDP